MYEYQMTTEERQRHLWQMDYDDDYRNICEKEWVLAKQVEIEWSSFRHLSKCEKELY